MKFLTAVALLSLVLLTGCEIVSENYSSTSLRAGIPYDSQKCATDEHAVSVISPSTGKPYCVRYQVFAGVNSDPRVAIALIPGDLVSFIARYADGRVVGEDYAPVPANSDSDLRARLLRNIRFNTADDRLALYLARPGTLGSSGRHADEVGKMNEVLVIDAALDALKGRYGIDRWILVGQSGGAAIVAMLMTRRDDLAGVVLVSGSLDKKQLHVMRGHRPETLQTDRYYDPIDHVAAIKPRLGGHILVMGDPEDSLVPFVIQQRYVDALRAAGLDVRLVVEESNGRFNHRLFGQGFDAALEIARELDGPAPPRRAAH